ncbi:MAG TPA: twin-arginine translocase subunit TatC [Limnochordia bacterium]|nr:twin-arginine translocase subunit TatC [Limnochordia bacterium]
MSVVTDHLEAEALATAPIEEHLRELRRRVLISVAAVIVAGAIGWWWAPGAIDYVRRGVKLLVFTSPGEAFMTYLRVAFSLGIGLALPVILWQAWRFVAPALFEHERRRVLLFAPLAVLMYAAGLFIGVRFVFPLSLHLFLGLSPDVAQPAVAVSRLWGFFLATTLPFGLIFQLPLILAAMLGLGLVSALQLRAWRRGVWVAAALVGGMLSPTVPSQLLMAAAIALMYELGSGLAVLLRLMPRAR